MISFKNTILFTCICCKPPVFLTVSILLVTLILTLLSFSAIVNELGSLSDNASLSTTLSESNLLVYSLLSMFGICWIIFFASLARFEISAEMIGIQSIFQHSEKGFRCIPVAVIHLIWVIIYEIAIFRFVNENLPKDRNFQDMFVGGTRLQVNSKDVAILVYSLWSSAVTYSFSYFITELIFTAFDGEETLVEVIHNAFVKIFVKITGIDLSDYPAGESLDNPIERNIVGQMRNEDTTPPALAEYATTEADNGSNESRAINRKRQKEVRYFSWNTLR